MYLQNRQHESAEPRAGSLEPLIMRSPDPPSRRAFLRHTGLSAGLAALASSSIVGAMAQPASDRAPDAVLARLLEGNQRFVKGQLLHPGRKPEDFAALAEGQAPLAIIVACADSRVAPELVFDQGIGDLFVVRVAGNAVSGAGPIVKGSIEFAVAELGARLIMVLGHSQCGAVKAAIEHIDANDVLPGSIRELVDLIRPAAAEVRGKPGDKLDQRDQSERETRRPPAQRARPHRLKSREDGGTESRRRGL